MIKPIFLCLCLCVQIFYLESRIGKVNMDRCEKVNETFSLFTWNMRANYSIAKPFITKYGYGCEFICLNDHGLFESELYKIENMYNDYSGHAKASKHLNNSDLGKRRGYGGCAVLWKKSLDNRIRPLPEKGTDRMCVVQFQTPCSIVYIVSVYLPHQTCIIDNFDLEIDKLNDLCCECNAVGSTILLGDTNCHFGLEYSIRSFGSSTAHARKLGNIIKACNMSVVDLSEKCTGPSYTWMSDNGRHVSYIDHVIVSEKLVPFVKSCKILEDDIINVSDHLPLLCTINVEYSIVKPSTVRPRVAWHKASASDIERLYTEPLEVQLENVMQEYNINVNEAWDEMQCYVETDINEVLVKFQCMIIEQSKALPASKFNKALKPYWNQNLTALCHEKKLAHEAWKNAGKPREPENEIYKKYKDAKRVFRSAHRRSIYDYEKENMEKLAKSQDIDQRFFWHLVNKKSRRVFSPVQDNNGTLLTDPCDIRNEWTMYFKDLFTAKYDPSWDRAFREEVDEEINGYTLSERAIPSGPPVSIAEVEKQLTKMKKGKAPGWDSVTLEHYKHGGVNMKRVIVWIMNYIMYTCDVPMYCKRGLLIPIPKGGKDGTVKDNNRGLTLLPVIYKLLEKILIEREEAFLHDQNVISRLQSAGQLCCSSLHTSFLAQEAIAYCVNRGMTVFKAFLDAQKAFDTVWINGLLYKLVRKGLSANTWHLIRSGYCNFKCAVFIGNENGDWFNIERGVHQGAPFSMWLYMVFVNDLLDVLCSNSIGVHINDVNVTSPAHADDIATMAMYKIGINRLLTLAFEYSLKWQYYYNLDKIVYMRWGADDSPNIPVVMGGTVVKHVKSWEHVGVTLCTDMAEHKADIKKRVNKAQGKLLASKGIGSHSIPVSVTVLSHIYWSVSVPSLTYGYDVLPLSESDIALLDNAHRKNAKIVQNVSVMAATPAPLAPIGWLTMKSYIAMCRIMFCFRLLCTNDNIYKDILLYRLDNIAMRGYLRPKHPSPVDCMFEALRDYDLVNDLLSVLPTRTFGLVSTWKGIVKKRVWEYEKLRWSMSISMYSSLDLYIKSVKSISMHPWYTVSKHRPFLAKKIACLMSVVMGSQPVGLSCNYSSAWCELCHMHVRETPLHVIFGCPELGAHRYEYLSKIYESMPLAMKNDFVTMTIQDKMCFMFSCLNVRYNKEWDHVYTSVANFIYEMYVIRFMKYAEKE